VKKTDPLSQLNEIMARLSANPNPNQYQTAQSNAFMTNMSMGQQPMGVMGGFQQPMGGY
jgi:hypothetical protein